MPKCQEITEILEKYAPLELKEDWDNVGFLVGDIKEEVTGILFALDLTMDVIREAINLGYNFIYTHHPLIFKPLYNVVSSDITGYLVMELIKNEINLYCAHTNLDKAIGGVNDKLAEVLGLSEVKALGAESVTTIGRVGVLNETMTLKEFSSLVSIELGCETLKYMGRDDKLINVVAVASGSASDFYMEAYNEGADVFVTSEIKHNIALNAKELDLALIDAGHFETENIILEDIADFIALSYTVPLCISKTHVGLFRKV